MSDAQRKYLFAVVFPNAEASAGTSANPGYITIPARPIRRIVADDAIVIAGTRNIIQKQLDRVFI